VPKSAQIHVGIGDPMLNIDPTSADTWYFDHATGNAHYRAAATQTPTLGDLMFDGNGSYKITLNSVLESDSNLNAASLGAAVFSVTEDGSNTSYFTSYDDSDDSTIQVTSGAGTDVVAKIHETSILIADHDATINLDEITVGDEWNAGEAITVSLIDADQNLNTRADEDLDLNSSSILRVPALQIGSPLSMGETTVGLEDVLLTGVATGATSYTVDTFSKIARVITTGASTTGTSTLITIDTGILVSDLESLVAAGGLPLLNVDIRSLISGTTITDTDFTIEDASLAGNAIYTTIDTDDDDGQFLVELPSAKYSASGTDGNAVHILITVTHSSKSIAAAGTYPIAADFFSFSGSVNNAIYRMELEETGDATGVFEGTIQYTMANAANNNAIATFTGLVPISNEIEIFLDTNYTTDVGAPRVNYSDLDALGSSTGISDQQHAPTHSGIAYLDAENYKTGDTVVLTVEDMDLNADGTLIDVHTVVAADENGTNSVPVLFNVMFAGTEWDGLNTSNLVETGVDTGVFTSMFAVPSGKTGNDMDVNYTDYRDSSGNTNEVGDSAGIRANTGSISLDRTVYPVPWGLLTNFPDITGKATGGAAVFPVHATGVATNLTANGDLIKAGAGDLTVTITVTDDDLNTSGSGEDKMNTDLADNHGPVKITVSRGSDEVILGYAGGATATTDKRIQVDGSTAEYREMGPITETAGDSGAFEFDFTVKYTDGPKSTLCPATDDYVALDGTADGATNDEDDRFNFTGASSTTEFCILQGDIITVEYTDSADASGNTNTVTDSATFDLRNGVLQSDKSVYIIGSDMILTIIEPDWDLNSGSAENYLLDVVEWDSSAKTTTIGDDSTAFDPEPSKFRETGDSTGIFQVVIEIPSTLNSNLLERGEQIDLTYTDWGPSGANYVGAEKEDLEATVYTSNFGATVELDQKVYTWTDKVYITIVAPDHNFDSSLIDSIGETADDPIKISTRILLLMKI
jgi:hypothetical protein